MEHPQETQFVTACLKATLGHDTVAHPEDAEFCSMFEHSLRTAQHFRLPVNGYLFNDQLRGLPDTNVRAPFKNITIEYGLDEKNARLSGHDAYLLNIRELGSVEKWRTIFDGSAEAERAIDDSPELRALPVSLITAMVRWADTGVWDLAPIMLVATLGKVEKAMRLMRFTTSIPSAEAFAEKEFGTMRTDVDYQKRSGRFFLSAVLELIEALACRNVSTEVDAVDPQVNAKRLAKGKSPLVSYHTLTVVAPLSPSGHGTTGGSHASPREHLRRGHIRRLGVDHTIWVNACVVSAGRPRLEKNYHVVTA